MTKNCDRKRTRRTQGGLGQEPSPVFHQTCVPSTRFLIANLELEFHVNPIRINELKFPNRKYFGDFSRSHFRPAHFALPASTSTASPSSIRRPASSFRNPWPPWRLIETPRLKSRATPTKQYPIAGSNRDKNGVLWFAFCSHSHIRSVRAPLCDSVPLWPSQPAASDATLTLRAPQSNLPASCFVRASLGEHS